MRKGKEVRIYLHNDEPKLYYMILLVQNDMIYLAIIKLKYKAKTIKLWPVADCFIEM